MPPTPGRPTPVRCRETLARLSPTLLHFHARGTRLDLFQVISLALMQGLTEFLPISTSAHLVLPSQLFGWPMQSLALDVAMHAGSLVAVVAYFRHDLAHFGSGTVELVPRRRGGRLRAADGAGADGDATDRRARRAAARLGRAAPALVVPDRRDDDRLRAAAVGGRYAHSAHRHDGIRSVVARRAAGRSACRCWRSCRARRAPASR